MNKTEFVEKVQSTCKKNVSKADITAVVDAALAVVMDEVAAGGSVQFVGFGTFEQAERSERQGRNPQSGKEMTIPATKVPKFKAGSIFKDKVKNA